ncbi:hydantoinase [Trichoderma arundinaceum]|uniref:Hydantoinase n=1 Tax=Trichoderma arundinaceum TaxID=490622 RepID=A0A395NEM1_TRIAR|nr:hydantoinase [Trichoderma arundinaceum]
MILIRLTTVMIIIQIEGGTNTDAVVACRTSSTGTDTGREPKTEILASYKSQTTVDITSGIQAAIRQVLATAQVPLESVISVNIGTTHFINAVVQADASNLERVAVLRLCAPFGKEVAPFGDFPPSLRNILDGYSAIVDGGLEIDGRPIREINTTEIFHHAEEIRRRGISTVIVVGVFSPLDTAADPQEEQVRQILQQNIPDIDVVCSRDLGRVGFLERENAAILNGSILKFARKTIRSFQDAIRGLGLRCPLFLTQNDGTVMDVVAAAVAPIKTFSSGATNSLTGAVFLANMQNKPLHDDSETENSQIIMVDVGGTTSDFAVLSKSGFPRQASATATIGGVRTAFSMPEVVSIGLGGGSLVQLGENGKVSVGPVSVGHRLQDEAICFGGKTLTATDIVIAKGIHDDSLPEWKGDISPDVLTSATRQIALKMERCIETMKTSDADVVLLLVGGGSIIQNSKLKNVKKCLRPPFYKVANAVGAAIAKVSGEVDRIIIPNGRSHEEIIDEIKSESLALAQRNGARPGHIEVTEIDLIPVQYVTNNAVRAIAKAVGELEWKPQVKGHVERSLNGTVHQNEAATNGSYIQPVNGTAEYSNNHVPLESMLFSIDLEQYVPDVSKETGEWFVSELDLELIGEGCGILGTGGGGSVYTGLLHSRQTLRSCPKKKMRIVDICSLSSDSNIGLPAFAGSPSVSNERLISGDELSSAAQELARFLDIDGYDAMMPAEIGGSNGMRAFAAAVSMDIPVVDADTMGRAFPKIDMALPYVFGQASPAPAVVSDARDNVQIIARVENSHRFENIVRAGCIELGLYTAVSMAPLKAGVVKKYCCLGTLSLAWFMGRAICLARQRKKNVVRELLNAMPGGRLLYTGKVVDIRREVKGGWTIGTATLEPFDNDDDEDDGDTITKPETRQLVLSYQNEFYSAELRDPTGKLPLQMICITPDLITVLDSHTGTALGTHELRYGLRVAAIGMPAHPHWLTKEGLMAGGPQAFG